MRSDLAERIRRLNDRARMAREDGNQVWGGWVWTREPDSSSRACVRVCPLEEYVQPIGAADRR